MVDFFRNDLTPGQLQDIAEDKAARERLGMEANVRNPSLRNHRRHIIGLGAYRLSTINGESLGSNPHQHWDTFIATRS